MTMQCRAVVPLTDYLAEEETAVEKNRAAFDHELEMAALVFEAGQEVFASANFVDSEYHRALAGLIATGNRAFGSAIGLCLRGSGAEAAGVMRTAIECAAYAVKITEVRSLVEKMPSLGDMTNSQRTKMFGSISDLLAQPLVVEPGQFYDWGSSFGVHAGWPLSAQMIDFDSRWGWRMRHGQIGDHFSRTHLLFSIFAMHSLVKHTWLPLIWGEPDLKPPAQILDLLEKWESARAEIGKKRRAYARWLGDPKLSALPGLKSPVYLIVGSVRARGA